MGNESTLERISNLNKKAYEPLSNLAYPPLSGDYPVYVMVFT